MSVNPSSLPLVDTRGHILECAEERFRTFGYGKTTMVEIAGDASMSAANLYRYFDNKQELGVASAKICIERSFAALRLVVRTPDLSATECLREFCIETVRWTYINTAEQPRVNELVEMILSHRPDMVNWRNSRICGLLAETLSRGNNSGEFDIDDVIDTAQSVHAALTMFQLLLFMTLYQLSELEARAIEVARVLARGLRPD